MTTYEAQLNDVPSDDFNVVLNMGGKLFYLRFQFDAAIKEQYDILTTGIRNLRDADPLLKEATIIRDYDYLDWYMSLPSLHELEQLLENGMEYPQSLKNLGNYAKAAKLLNRKAQVEELQDVFDTFDECMYWKCTITDEANNEVQCSVVPGGYVNNQSSEWTLRFESDLDRIGEDDLMKIRILMEVADD